VPDEYDGLELSVRRLMDRYEAWRRRAREAERRVEELQATVRRLSSGGLDPVALQQQADTLQAQNAALRRRMDQAHQRIQKMVARFDFLQDER